MFIGIGSCFVGIIDLLHALSYPGIGIFVEASINLATQLPIISGFIWSITLLMSNIFIIKPIKKFPGVAIYIVFTLFLISSIAFVFYFKVFPPTYIDGHGLTNFKIVSEYTIILILLVSGIFFYKNRKILDNTLFRYVVTSILLGIISRFSLTLLRNDISDISNIIAHIFKVIWFLCIYKGIVQVGLQRPLDMLSNRLNEVGASLKYESRKRKEMEDILIENEKCYELLIENNKDAIFVHSEGRIVFANQVATKFTAVVTPKDLIGTLVKDILPKSCMDTVIDQLGILYNNQENIPPIEINIPDLNGEPLDIEVEFVRFVYKGKPTILNIVRDISTRKKIKTLEKDIEITREFSHAQAEFFANISHELKTPLNVLL
jgi:PAS domain S-box-containing protein